MSTVVSLNKRKMVEPLKCTVIICTKNRAEDLAITLDSLGNQNRPAGSVIIVDDSIDESTQRIVDVFRNQDGYPRILNLRKNTPSSGIPQARNRGLTVLPSETDIVLFLDDDVTLDKNYLDSLLCIFEEHPEVKGAQGFIELPIHAKPWYYRVGAGLVGTVLPTLLALSWYTPDVTLSAENRYPLFQRRKSEWIPCEWLAGCNMAYRSELFKDGLTFDENLILYALGEDGLFSYRLHQMGKTLALSYKARVVHRFSVGDRLPRLKRMVMDIVYRKYVIHREHSIRGIAELCFFLYWCRLLLTTCLLSIRHWNIDYLYIMMKAWRMIGSIKVDNGSSEIAALNRMICDINISK